MALERYHEKRDFTKTREPRGKAERRKGFSYVVQKHAASHLHYDFRLELDGVLLSWAVPKGPSLDPSVKRLAMQVEDHPVDYGDFEGTIPKGQYGGGTVMVWDTGSWEPKGDPRAGYRKGRLDFELHGKKLKGAWHLVRSHGDEEKPRWLLFKATDAHAKPATKEITETRTKSASTGRSLEQIAAAGDRVWHSNREGAGTAEKKTVPKKVAAKKPPPPKRPATSRAGGQSDLADLIASLSTKVAFTHLDKMLYPDRGITKGAIIAYYAIVADWLLPHLSGRPLMLVRCPDGATKQGFFQKHAKKGVSAAIGRIALAEGGEEEEYMVVTDRDGLLAAVQMGSLELHVWGSRAKRVETPDIVVFDLDPDPSVGWPQVVDAATSLREFLRELELESWVKTTGGKGLHVVVPIEPRRQWHAVKAFSKGVATEFAALAPRHFTINPMKAQRKGKIFLDYLRNGRGATAIAPYSTRAREGAPVATPITWAELERGAKPADFDIVTVPVRLQKLKRDPWDGILEAKQRVAMALLRRFTGR